MLYLPAMRNMADIVTEWIKAIGEDPSREGLVKTPERVAEAWKFMSRGYNQSAAEVINGAVFEAVSQDMVIVKDIEVYSMCEHHLLPFFGRCHIGYIPNGKVIGVSKLARIADMFARRLQIQERLTNQIAEALMEHLQPDGVGVVMEAQHLCMMMRGVEKQNSLMITSSVLGSFRTCQPTRTEFLKLLDRRSRD
jgi:GTP cyclohydrolase I